MRQALKGAEKVTDQLNKSMESLRKKVEKQQNEINELYDQQDNIEQYTRKNSLEIHGIPEELYTSTEDVIIKLGEQLQVPISPEDIEISHKLYSGKNNPKNIIVRFISHKKKSQLYKKRTELRKIKQGPEVYLSMKTLPAIAEYPAQVSVSLKNEKYYNVCNCMCIQCM